MTPLVCGVFFRQQNICTVSAWTQAGDPGNFLKDILDAASLFWGWGEEFSHVDLYWAVTHSQPKNSAWLIFFSSIGTGAHIILGN